MSISNENSNPTVIVTVEQAIIIVAAFPGLDGFAKAVGEKVIAVPFKFTDETRKKLRAWKRVLKPVAEDFDEARIAIVRELSPVNENVADEPLEVRNQFETRRKALLAEKHEFQLPLIKQDGDILSEGKNPVPDTILEALEPICVEGATLKVEDKAEKPEGGEA